MSLPDPTDPHSSHRFISNAGEDIREMLATIGVDSIDRLFDTIPDAVKLDAGDELGSIESVKAVSELFAPVSGVVTEVNEALADNPALVNTDPWGDGWMIRVKISDVTEVDELMTAEEYDEFLEKESGH